MIDRGEHFQQLSSRGLHLSLLQAGAYEISKRNDSLVLVNAE